jgi:hypothetical protein
VSPFQRLIGPPARYRNAPLGSNIGPFDARKRRSAPPDPQEGEMIVRDATAAGMALILSAAVAHAGPCTDRIYQTGLDVAKLLNSAAAQGRPARQSAFATMHRQPTPGSIASAEQDAGDLTSEEVQAITEAMDEARRADDAGDRDGCEKALDDIDRMLKN